LPALNDVAEEGNRDCTELAFLSLYIEYIFQQLLEHLPGMLDVVLLVTRKKLGCRLNRKKPDEKS
jgi:hypothetical protein